MGNKILIVSGVAFWLLAVVFLAGKTGLLKKIQEQSRETVRETECAKDEEYALFGSGIGGCYKLPKDSGKPCSVSTGCESGYCVTKEVRAKEGVCFKSNAHLPCVFGYWTIEESQALKQTPGEGKSAIFPFCVY